MIFPLPAFAAGGYIGPTWLTFLMNLFLVPPLLLFLHIGYLSFLTPQENRLKFISLYALILLCVAAFVASTAHLFTHENVGWIESTSILSLMFLPILMAYSTYKLNSAVGEKHTLKLRNSWYAAIASIALMFVFPFLLITIQMMFPFMQFYL
jgi:hypothetical protein